MPATSVIVVDNLEKKFDLGPRKDRAFSAVAAVSFQVEPNTAFGFLGPNGAGKTTTIKMLTGLIFPTAGRVTVLGGAPSDAAVRARFGYLPENPSFPDHLTGAEILRFACELLGLPRARIAAEVERCLALVDLKRAANLQVRKYSKGMVQRVGIAQALLGSPELVILDEPMSGLDPIGRRDIKDLILSLRREGKTVFFSTHIISDVEEICDDVAIIVNGKIARKGRVSDLLGGTRRETEITARDLPGDFPGRKGEGATATLVVDGETELRATMERIFAAGGQVLAVRPRRYGLEDVFLEEVRKEPNRPMPVGES
ncbi:MAG: ABC transporter ATP-binding protein [Deltaproteobacteria bacterium]|nr:ABC transporter ATP-binding protein [Deltaproteobacteria bacterium]